MNFKIEPAVSVIQEQRSIDTSQNSMLKNGYDSPKEQS